MDLARKLPLPQGEPGLAQLLAKCFNGPGGTAAAKEVLIASEDTDIKGQRERNRRPVIRIPWDASPRYRFLMRVDAARDDLDPAVVDERLYGLMQ